jgi:hypothetical protein
MAIESHSQIDHPSGRDRAPADPSARPSKAQLAYLRRGVDQPGGKLPLFDAYGQRIADRTVHSCIDHGWAEPWFNNPLKPDWLVCKLTQAGRDAVARG